MKGGLIECICGQEQWVETVNDTIGCISCGELHDVSMYPEIIKVEPCEEVVEEEDEEIEEE